MVPEAYDGQFQAMACMGEDQCFVLATGGAIWLAIHVGDEQE
ncbi:MAG: hypothetical protein R3B03_12570 [Nitrospirales bacterium]